MSVWTHSMTELTSVDIWFTMLSSYFLYPKSTTTMFCGIIYTIEISYYSIYKMDGRSNARHPGLVEIKFTRIDHIYHMKAVH